MPWLDPTAVGKCPATRGKRIYFDVAPHPTPRSNATPRWTSASIRWCDIAARQRYVEPLQGLGYTFVPDPASPDFHFFAKPRERPRSHHLHVCEAGSEDELRHIAVRDFLRANGAQVSAYEMLERDLLQRFPEDRLEYIAGKRRYLDELQAGAVEWARRQ